MCTVPKRSFLSGSTSLRYHRGTLHGRQRTTPFSVNSACATAGCRGTAARASSREQTARPVRGTCCFSCFHCYFYCESVSLGSSVLRYHRAQCVVWVVGPQYKSYACSAPGAGLSINYTRVVHAGRLYIYLWELPIVHCMYVLVELPFTYQTIVALSSKLTKATTKVHTRCYLRIYIPFLLGLCPTSKKYMEQVEKSFL